MPSAVISRSRSTEGSPPPTAHEGPPDGGGGGGGSDWVKLVSAANDIDAHLLAGRLVEAGIEIHTIKDRSGPGAWLIAGSNPWAPVHIMVRRLSLDDARLVLAELAWASPSASPDERPTTRPSALWWATAIALGLMLTGVILAQLVEATSSEPASRPARPATEQER
jgi:hypothetical protein